MIKLLKIEWLKVKGYTAFVLLTSFFALGVVAINYIVYAFKKEVVDKVEVSKLLLSGSPFEFDMVWQSVSYYSSYFLMLPALLIVILISNEFTFKTHRQNIIDGWSRMDFLKVKIAFAVLLAIASTLVVVLTSLTFGLLSGTTFSLHGFQNVGYFLLKAITYNMVAILISLLTKRSGVAIAVFFIYTIFENGISMMLFFLAVNIKKDSNVDLGNLGNYLPMNASDGLLTSPLDSFANMANQFLPSDYNWIVLSFALVYLLLFFFWSKRKMLCSDL
jgi:ABC-2 type transport system permease protein